MKCTQQKINIRAAQTVADFVTTSAARLWGWLPQAIVDAGSHSADMFVRIDGITTLAQIEIKVAVMVIVNVNVQN